MSKSVKIGCLALQGAVELHRPHIEAAGAEFTAVKTPEHFDSVDGFILPGGESTTMLKLIERFKLWDTLADHFARKPVWGICAGTILMAQTVHYSHDRVEDQNGDVQKSFALLPITVERNGYGRQIDSHTTKIDGYDVSFIRAPIIQKFIQTCPDDVDVRAEHDGNPVWIEQGQYMATTFHPELSLKTPSPMHQIFVESVREAIARTA